MWAAITFMDSVLVSGQLAQFAIAITCVRSLCCKWLATWLVFGETFRCIYYQLGLVEINDRWL